MKNLGQALLGFGFIFLGMKVMNDGLAPLAAYDLTRQVLVALAGNPFMGLLVGAVLSAGMASSAATIGLMLSVVQQGLLPLDGAIPVVLGANIGTCATAFAASLRSTADARRVALAHIAFKVLGVALVFPFIDPLTSLVARTAGDAARQVANAHTLFNVAISALFLPFAPWAADAIAAMVPDDAQAENPYRTRYLDDRYLDQPALAIGQATREALRMGDVAQSMLRDAMVVLRTNDQELLEDVERRDDQLDYLEREIKIFLSRLGRETMSADLAQKEIALISFIGNLENIGDIIDKNLMELARKKLYQGRRFSEAGEMELIEFHGLVSKNLERAIAGFAANDRSLAQEVLDQRPDRPPARARAARVPSGTAAPRPRRVARDLGDPPRRPDQSEADLVARHRAGVPDPRGGLADAWRARLRILFMASEVEPFAKTGGLADVAGALPRALAAPRPRRAHPHAEVPRRGGHGRVRAHGGAGRAHLPRRPRGGGRPPGGPRALRRADVLPRPGPLLRPRAALRHRRRGLLGQLRALRLLLPRGTRGGGAPRGQKTAARPGARRSSTPMTGRRASCPSISTRSTATIRPWRRSPRSSPSTTSPTRACSGTTTCR